MRQLVFFKKDLEHVAWKMDNWIKINYPQHYTTLSSHLSQEYQKWTGEVFDITAIDPQQFRKQRHSLFNL